MAVDLSLTIGPLELSSPLILGSFDAIVDATVMGRCFELCGDRLGAVVTKSTTVEPRAGYPEPKVSRFGGGLLVASGNTNPGIGDMTTAIRQFKKQFPGRVVLGSVVSDPDHPHADLAEEYCLLAREYAGAGVDGLELNLSCPHLDPQEKEHTIVPAQDPNLVAQLTGAVKTSLAETGHGHCVVIPKLTGWNCDPAKAALAAEQAGADAVTISNLFPGTGYHTGLLPAAAEDSDNLKIGDYLIAHGKGGYSGKAMHGAVLLMIENLRKYLRIPIIGAGGCATDLDSLVQTFMAGAAAVQSVTPFYFRTLKEMDALLQVNDLIGQIKAYLDDHGLKNPEGLYRIRSRSDNA